MRSGGKLVLAQYPVEMGKKPVSKLPGWGLNPEQGNLQWWLAIVAGEVGFGSNPLQFAYRPAGLGGTALELIGPDLSGNLRRVVAAD